MASIPNCPCLVLQLWPYQNFINSLITQEEGEGRLAMREVERLVLATVAGVLSRVRLSGLDFFCVFSSLALNLTFAVARTGM
jgi:hypothetical protein